MRKRLTLTPLIDVIFLLLLFFMLSSTFSRFGEVELLGTPSGNIAAETPDLPPYFLRLGAEQMDLNGQVIAMTALTETLGGQTAPHVLLTIKDGVSAQRLTDLMVVLRDLNGLRLTVLGDGA